MLADLIIRIVNLIIYIVRKKLKSAFSVTYCGKSFHLGINAFSKCSLFVNHLVDTIHSIIKDVRSLKSPDPKRLNELDNFFP